MLCLVCAKQQEIFSPSGRGKKQGSDSPKLKSSLCCMLFFLGAGMFHHTELLLKAEMKTSSKWH